MKQFSLVSTIILAGSLLLQLTTLCFPARGAAGDVDLSFDAGSGVNGGVRAVVLQPDGKMIIGGEFTMVKGLARYTVARLNTDGSGDATFDVDPGIAEVWCIALQSDGKVLVGFRHGIARLNSDGSRDPGFILPGLTGDDLTSAGVSSIAVQADGMVLIGGAFTMVNGADRGGIARLNANGSLDSSFIPDTGVGPVSSVAVQPDGKVLIAGLYGIARLNADGSWDPTFNPDIGTDSNVLSIALQTDAKVLLSGYLYEINGTFRTIARLNADGSLDSSFDPGTGANRVVYSVASQSDGKVLMGGWFTSVNGTNRNRIARLNANGSVDSTFDPGPGSRAEVMALAVQLDGRVLAGCVDFEGGIRAPFNFLTRLNGDGRLDGTFSAGGGINRRVYSLVLQPDGKALVGGSFTSVNSTVRKGIARLHADGSLDSSFDPGLEFSRFVRAIALQPDGKVLVNGHFTSVNDTNRNGIARLNPDGSLDHSFNPGLIGEDSDVRLIVLQSDGKVLIGGAVFDDPFVPAANLVRLNSDGSLDSTFNPLRGTHVQSIAPQADGRILVGGQYAIAVGTSIHGMVRLHADGTLDSSFRFQFAGAGTSIASSIVLQSDGRMFIGGVFGEPGSMLNCRIARLHADGSMDTSFHADRGFDPGAGVLGAGAVTLQPDGKVLAAGAYYLGNNEYIQGIYRLNTDGSLDRSFNANNTRDTGAYGVSLIALQPDGHVLVGGDFVAVNGVVRPYVARLYGHSVVPSLSITHSGAFAILSWPVTVANFQLHETTDLSMPNSWFPVPETAVTNGAQFSVTVPTTAPRKFFRLKTQ